jgi:hypothetical protein
VSEPIDLAAKLAADGWPAEKAAKLIERAEEEAAAREEPVADVLDEIVKRLWDLSGADPRNP